MTNLHCCERLMCRSADKRVSAVAISHHGKYVAFADKFGVIWLITLDEDDANQSKVDNKAVPIFGHYCSIITRLEFSPDDRFIASSDRDFKIRVCISFLDYLGICGTLPVFGVSMLAMLVQNQLCVEHLILSSLHLSYVSCLSFACPSGYGHGFLFSGGGDSTVRLWDFFSGLLLATSEVGAKVVTLEENYFPTSLALSTFTQRMWTIMGASNHLAPSTTQLPTRIRVISGFCKGRSDDNGHDPIVLEDNEVPGGGKLLSHLQGSPDVTKKDAALAAAAEAVKVSMRNMLIKKEYTSDKRELRKRNRNDKKLR
ncbi:hypothetical protein GW17_00023646 [Ensete ventricosum]|nr:hypothetical protein GW17_00023646 [Ensete ventricosum]